MSEQAEIVTKPPSHPIASTMLVLSALGTVLCIAFVWAELFGEYLPSMGPGQKLDPLMGKHDPRQEAKAEGLHDHYKQDYPQEDVLADIETELGITSSVGGGLGN